MMAKFNLLSKDEAESLMSFYFSQSVPYSFGMLPNGKPAFMLKNTENLIINKDGSVTWTAREIGVSLHSFIELTTGEEKKRIIYIPLCLVNPVSRKCLKLLLDTTRNPVDGRYNSQKAELYILTPNGQGTKIHFQLPNLTMQYVIMQLVYHDFALKFKSKHCAFCREA